MVGPLLAHPASRSSRIEPAAPTRARSFRDNNLWNKVFSWGIDRVSCVFLSHIVSHFYSSKTKRGRKRIPCPFLFARLSPINHFELARIDINYQPVYWNPGQVGAVADHRNNLFDVDMDIVERAEPAHQPLLVLQSLLLYQTLRVDAERLHGSDERGWIRVSKAAIGMADDGDFTHAKQVDAPGQRTNQVVIRARSFWLGDGGSGGAQFQHIAAFQAKRLFKHLHQPAVHAGDNCHVLARRVSNRRKLRLLDETLVMRQNLINNHKNNPLE